MRRHSSYLSTYLEGKQNRRERRAKRRKQIETGIPASVPLKTISLSPEQQREISAVQTRSHDTSENQIVTPRRFSLLISLCFHLIMALMATLYIVKNPKIDDDAVIAEIIHVKKPRKNILRRPKRVQNVKPTQSLKIRNPRVRSDPFDSASLLRVDPGRVRDRPPASRQPPATISPNPHGESKAAKFPISIC